MGKSNNSTFVIFMFEISKYRQFYIWSFQILESSSKCENWRNCEWYGISNGRTIPKFGNFGNFDSFIN